jgi:hypothetical protein
MRDTKGVVSPSRRHMDSVIQSHPSKSRLPEVHLGVSQVEKPPFVSVVRYNGKWYTIAPKTFEPERMTTDVAWLQIKEGLTAEQAYVRWFEQQRKISRVLQQ